MMVVRLEPKTFGQWLQEARGIRKAIALAERAGITPQMWSDLENDRSRRKDGLPARPTVETCRKIASALGIDLDEVLKHAGYPLYEWSVDVPGFIQNDPDFADEDPILLSIQAFYHDASPALRQKMLGEMARLVIENQKEQTTHGRKAELSESPAVIDEAIKKRIEELERIKAEAIQQIYDLSEKNRKNGGGQDDGGRKAAS